MRRLVLVVLICCIESSYASFVGSINSLFGVGGSHKHRKTTAVKDEDGSLQLYQQFCTNNATAYGYQIKCERSSQITHFKADASASIHCNQRYRGISQQFPESVIITQQFIASLNLCPAVVYGPNILKRTSVIEESSGLIQDNDSKTYYDVVCNGKSSYESTIYLRQQQEILNAESQQIQQCINLSQPPQARNFVMMFYICIGLALVALGVFAFRVYRNKHQDFDN
jgi:hypothetical protein